MRTVRRTCSPWGSARTTRKNGVFRRKLIGKSRRCRVPSQITASETVIFTTAT